MTVDQAAIDAVLGDFVPVGDDHPAVADFGEAVAQHIAARPSPSAAPSDAPEWAQRIERKLDLILSQLGGGTP